MSKFKVAMLKNIAFGLSEVVACVDCADPLIFDMTFDTMRHVMCHVSSKHSGRVCHALAC